VKPPGAARGVTAADCEAGPAGRRCRDAPRPAGDMTLPGAIGRVTAVDCQAGPAGRRRSWGGDMTLPGAARGVTAADWPATHSSMRSAIPLMSDTLRRRH
jgi:hypothetical protein